MGWNDFNLPACGEWYDNEDGSSRQAELALCEVGDPILLTREPENPHDRNAVALFTLRGIRVGYLARDRAQWLGSKIDRGYTARAIVERIKGQYLEGSALGLVIRVALTPVGDGIEEPDLAA